MTGRNPRRAGTLWLDADLLGGGGLGSLSRGDTWVGGGGDTVDCGGEKVGGVGVIRAVAANTGVGTGIV